MITMISPLFVEIKKIISSLLHILEKENKIVHNYNLANWVKVQSYNNRTIAHHGKTNAFTKTMSNHCN